ncbi:MAG: hypothetical protein ABIR47_09300 [Candidatus Kapaibacterium sp.]
MERTYYLCHYRLDNRDSYLIWYADDIDGIVTDAERNIIEYSGPDIAARYADSHQFRIANIAEPAHYDFDRIERWLMHGEGESVSCEDFLDAWNLFTDISCSVGGDFDNDVDRTAVVYDKLFFGNNLPSVSPPGEIYVPEWVDDELSLLRGVLSDGLRMFRENLVRLE